MLMLLLGSTKPSPCSRWRSCWRSCSCSCSCSYSLYKTRSLAIERLQHRGGSVSSSIVAADVEDIPGEDRSSDVNNTRPTNRKIRTRTRTNNSNTTNTNSNSNSNSNNIRCRIPEAVWRKSAREHARKIREIILPGLTPLDHPLNTGLQRQIKQRERERERGREQYRSKQQQQQQQQQSREKQQEQQQQLPSSSSDDYRTTTMVTALDPKHPVYNFLIEYYGLKGTKGVRRLMKWSPGIMAITDDNNNNNDDNDANDCHGDILLEGATEQDFSTTLQTKGAYIYWENNDEPQHNNEAQQNGQSGDCDGIAYSPFHFVYGNNKNKNKNQSKKPNNDNFGLESGDGGDDEQQQQQQQQQQRRGDKPCVAPKTTTTQQQQQQDGPLAAFLWYRSLLKRTTEASPVLHCYGLHEWAMQYRPQQHPPRAVNNDGANNSANNSANSNNSNNANVSGKESVPPLPLPPPPSAKYQSHLKLRVDRRTLNETVETNTIFCTHVDAWKFFAEEALPLNTFRNKHKHKTVDGTARSSSSSSLALQLPSPKDRPALLLRSEQPACVHTTMDLLKIALKLGPFCDAELFRKVVAVAIRARSLDVAASPYDANSNCDYGIEPIRIETRHGRNEYRRRQTELMKRAAEPVRKELLEEYERFLSVLV